mgnify:CR=1 FL=1
MTCKIVTSDLLSVEQSWQHHSCTAMPLVKNGTINGSNREYGKLSQRDR